MDLSGVHDPRFFYALSSVYTALEARRTRLVAIVNCVASRRQCDATRRCANDVNADQSVWRWFHCSHEAVPRRLSPRRHVLLTSNYFVGETVAASLAPTGLAVGSSNLLSRSTPYTRALYWSSVLTASVLLVASTSYMITPL